MDKTKCYNRGKEEALRSDSGGLFCGDFLEREKREGNWQGKRVLEVLGCSRQTALLRRAASAAPDGGSPCLGRRESIQSLGPRKIGDFAGKGKRERVIWRGERVLEVLGCSRQTALLRRAASAASDGGSPCLGRRESIQSLGPPQNRRFCGEREKREGNFAGETGFGSAGMQQPNGASAPRRQCGVRRREPVSRATGVYSISGAPTKSEILWGKGKERG